MNKICNMEELATSWRPLGRTWLCDGSLWFDYTCSGFELALNCKGVVTAVVEWSGLYGKIGVSVDGGEMLHISIQQGCNRVVLAHGLTEGDHIIRVEKLSEASRAAAKVDCVGFDGEPLSAPKAPKKRMLAIGDSLTAGLWNETYAHEVHEDLFEQGFYQDGSKTWSALAARELGMDYTAIAFSGWGVVSGYGNHPENNVPRVLDCTLPFGNESVKWDYEADSADIILINLSTNDSSVYNDPATAGNPSKEEVAAAAKSLCQKLRQKYPTAPIIWANGLSGTGAFEEEIKAAVSGEGMHYVVLPCNQEGGQWHPTVEGHIAACKALIEEIRDLGVIS